jgi:hypothetical protein
MKFCPSCGSKMIMQEPPKSGIEPQITVKSESKETKKEDEFNWGSAAVGVIALLLGFGALMILYVFPYLSINGAGFSIAEINSFCSNPLVRVAVSSYCGGVSSIFIIGWIIAILFIIGGLYELYYSTKKH